MLYTLAASLSLVAAATALGYPDQDTCPTPLSTLRTSNTTVGICPSDLDVIGGELVPVHDSTTAPTGIAVDRDANIYFTYARNSEPQNWTLTKATGFDTEEPWPSAEWQNCKEDQDASTCFVNVQNLVLDDKGLFWVIDSGVPYGA